MLPFQPWGVIPTWPEISATFWLTESNIPDRLLVIPPTRSSLSHSVMASHRKSIGVYPPFCPSRIGREGLGFWGDRLAEKPGELRNEQHTDQGNAAARHELFYPQLGVKTLLDGGRRRTKNLYGAVKRTVPAGQVRQ